MPSHYPEKRPRRPYFSSGPCAKRPGWSVSALEKALVGRSHRSSEGKERLKQVIEKSKRLLQLPDNYLLGIVPGSDTGAVEMALWSLLGARGVDVLGWESFGLTWVSDVLKQLKLEDVRDFSAAYGELPDLSQVDTDRDVVFTWNGTTSGVKVPNADWIKNNRKGLTICDATSAVFAMPLPWEKLDVVTYSWQKALGGEAAHGILILSPRAVARLQSYTPVWPLPKVFRLTKKGQLIDGIFVGQTINTPSMLCVEDALDALNWVESIGGLDASIERSEKNLAAIAAWVEKTPWIEFLAKDAAMRSSTSICLSLTTAVPSDAQGEVIGEMCKFLAAEKIAFDIKGYRDAPPSIRIWGGSTVDTEDIEALLPWLDVAFVKATKELDLKVA